MVDTSSVVFVDAGFAVVVLASLTFFVILLVSVGRFATAMIVFIVTSAVLLTSFATFFSSGRVSVTAIGSVLFFSGTLRSGGGSNKTISDLISVIPLLLLKVTSLSRVGSGATVGL